MQERFPKLQFRKLGCDLSKGPYLEEIQEGTKDLNIQLIFNNAGFITVGMLHKTALGRNLANFECNATASIKLTHHFVNKLTADKQKGAPPPPPPLCHAVSTPSPARVPPSCQS